MKRTIIVFDFETTGLDVNSPYCQVVEIGSVAIHSKSLKIIKGSEFFIEVRPEGIEKDDFYENRSKTIDWHVGLKPGRTKESMIEHWKKGTPEKEAFGLFMEYCAKYKWGHRWDTAPTPGGNNIINYDLPILQRFVEKYKLKYPFFKRDRYDLQQMVLYALGYSLDMPRSYTMDDLRLYFGLPTEDSHNALYDAKQEAELISLLARKFRSWTKSFQARGCFINE